ncbi:hypothetical protein EDD33_2757 [Nocardioides aurantiacus]|uniref:Enoyl-ACP reductase-like protein n=1 Tax=Nocardioides aurantiacus TaxID=86796 RepID=A0A3N2CWF4_9ACTN|nr:hypothetical protein EDD33_2757 [Nocardioides aurantiacus]
MRTRRTHLRPGCRGTRVNSVAPRAGQPVELAPLYVVLASDEAGYVSGARVAVTGGRPIL